MYSQYIFFELFLQEKTLEYTPRVKRIEPVVERVLYSLKAEGSAKPEAESSATFEQTVTSHSTSSYP